MDEAAREAAGAEVPPFLDDDDEPKPYGATAYGGPGGFGHAGGYNAQGDWSSSGGGGIYSDTASHGTYAQPPMSHESYPMHDFGNSSGVGPGGIFEHGSAGAGAFAAGAAAAHDARSGAPSSNTAVGDSPYPAFLHPGAYENGAGVGPGGYPNMNRGQQGFGNGGFDEGVVAGGAAGMAGIGRRSSMNAVNRMKSQNSGALSGPGAPSVPEEPHYPPAGAPGNSQPDLLNRSTSSGSGNQGQGAGAGGFTAGGASFSNAVHDAAYGGHEQQSSLPNPFTSKMESDEGGDAAEDPYGGYGTEGEEEEEHRPKVLKVANE
ncbi:hypothetical protein GYMLUDRAFT_927656 [Collybiopsis luxurians FD-317 M1]|nr:hypothetical protein GYMLUDRAFT_927656 [Collybiopsis luxurians FD-317 M1]